MHSSAQKVQKIFKFSLGQDLLCTKSFPLELRYFLLHSLTFFLCLVLSQCDLKRLCERCNEVATVNIFCSPPLWQFNPSHFVAIVLVIVGSIIFNMEPLLVEVPIKRLAIHTEFLLEEKLLFSETKAHWKYRVRGQEDVLYFALLRSHQAIQKTHKPINNA